jgi:hypothetical protein
MNASIRRAEFHESHTFCGAEPPQPPRSRKLQLARPSQERPHTENAPSPCGAQVKICGYGRNVAPVCNRRGWNMAGFPFPPWLARILGVGKDAFHRVPHRSHTRALASVPALATPLAPETTGQIQTVTGAKQSGTTWKSSLPVLPPGLRPESARGLAHSTTQATATAVPNFRPVSDGIHTRPRSRKLQLARPSQERPHTESAPSPCGAQVETCGYGRRVAPVCDRPGPDELNPTL